MTGPTKPTPRQIVAEVVLRDDLPLPTEIDCSDGGSLRLKFDTIADAVPWCRFLGASDRTYNNTNGYRYLECATAEWKGWRVYLWAGEPIEPADPLDDDTKARLTALAEGVPA